MRRQKENGWEGRRRQDRKVNEGETNGKVGEGEWMGKLMKENGWEG